MIAQQFFHRQIGAKLGLEAGQSVKSVGLPHRAKTEVKQLSLGQIGCFYIACETEASQLIGRVDLPSRPGLVFVGTEKLSAQKHVAEWLLHSAQPPFMVGVIEKAHPETSFKLTTSLAAMHFCDTAGGFTANLVTVREAHEKIRHLNWKKTVAPAIHKYHAYLDAPMGENALEKAQLQKLLDKTPELAGLLPSLGIRPNSGEYTLLSWLNIERKD